MLRLGIDGINIFKRQFSDVIRGWNDTGSFLGYEFCWKAAMDMVYEVRRQFREIQELWRTGKPE
jgi:hypothetical protein